MNIDNRKVNYYKKKGNDIAPVSTSFKDDIDSNKKEINKQQKIIKTTKITITQNN